MQALGGLLWQAWTAIDNHSGEHHARPFVVYLNGDLGTGKTRLVRAFLENAGYQGRVRSPSYTLVEPYELTHGLLLHMDLYRLSDPMELEFLGLEDMAACSWWVEWPDKGGSELMAADLEISLSYQGYEQGRAVELVACSPRAASFVDRFSPDLQLISR